MAFLGGYNPIYRGSMSTSGRVVVFGILFLRHGGTCAFAAHVTHVPLFSASMISCGVSRLDGSEIPHVPSRRAFRMSGWVRGWINGGDRINGLGLT